MTAIGKVEGDIGVGIKKGDVSGEDGLLEVIRKRLTWELQRVVLGVMSAYCRG